MANKTLVVTTELRVTLPEEAIELLEVLTKQRNSTQVTDSTGLSSGISLWDYSPDEKVIGVEVEE